MAIFNSYVSLPEGNFKPPTGSGCSSMPHLGQPLKNKLVYPHQNVAKKLSGGVNPLKNSLSHWGDHRIWKMCETTCEIHWTKNPHCLVVIDYTPRIISILHQTNTHQNSSKKCKYHIIYIYIMYIA